MLLCIQGEEEERGSEEDGAVAAEEAIAAEWQRVRMQRLQIAAG